MLTSTAALVGWPSEADLTACPDHVFGYGHCQDAEGARSAVGGTALALQAVEGCAKTVGIYNTRIPIDLYRKWRSRCAAPRELSALRTPPASPALHNPIYTPRWLKSQCWMPVDYGHISRAPRIRLKIYGCDLSKSCWKLDQHLSMHVPNTSFW